MRIAPVGIFFRKDSDKLMKAVIEISQMTHLDIRGVAGAGLIAFCIMWLIPRTDFSPAQLLAEACTFVREMEEKIIADYPSIASGEAVAHQVSQMISHLPSLLELDIKQQGAALDELIGSISGDLTARHHSSFVLGSVIFSFILLLQYGSNMEKAMIAGVNQGGDTDTIGAITGALCAALGGTESVPERWFTLIPEYEELEKRADALVLGQNRLSAVRPLYERETRLCQMEDQYRANLTVQLKKRFVC